MSGDFQVVMGEVDQRLLAFSHVVVVSKSPWMTVLGSIAG